MANSFQTVDDVCCFCAHDFLLERCPDLYHGIHYGAPNSDIGSAYIHHFLELHRKTFGHNMIDCCFFQSRVRSRWTPTLLDETTEIVRSLVTASSIRSSAGRPLLARDLLQLRLYFRREMHLHMVAPLSEYADSSGFISAPEIALRLIARENPSRAGPNLLCKIGNVGATKKRYLPIGGFDKRPAEINSICALMTRGDLLPTKRRSAFACSPGESQ